MTKEQSTGINWTILLVDDEPTQRLITARLLTRGGYDVETAVNGLEALRKIEARDFQFMITDWEMPEMDGLALCRAMRSRSRSYIYTIFLSPRDAVEHVVSGLQAGADDYLTKPVSEPELIARLNTGKRIVSLERSLRVANEENIRLIYAHPLTGVYNRAFLTAQLPRAIELAGNRNDPLSLILCDADYLKGVNDRFGHEIGGRTLIAVAQLFASLGREAGGWLSHHGGDEFSIALPSIKPAAAGAIAEHMRSTLCREAMMLSGIEVSITASFGVSGWDCVPQQALANDLLRVADECVYASKRAGRNRVTVRAQP